jgi:hypothetical protein
MKRIKNGAHPQAQKDKMINDNPGAHWEPMTWDTMKKIIESPYPLPHYECGLIFVEEPREPNHEN